MKTRQDLEQRTEEFALKTRELVHLIKLTPILIDDVRQLLRSSGSVAANYIEAVEALSSKDFLYRHKVCRKEAKETILWLKLIRRHLDQSLKVPLDVLLTEADELKRIFSSTIIQLEKKLKD